MSGFKVTNKFANGTSLKGYFTTSFEQLREHLGEPMPATCFDGKVSTEWVLEDADGNAATIYDYKETNLYEYGYPGVAEFRSRYRYEWHIGAQSKEIAQALIDWLKDLGIEDLSDEANEPDLRDASTKERDEGMKDLWCVREDMGTHDERIQGWLSRTQADDLLTQLRGQFPERKFWVCADGMDH